MVRQAHHERLKLPVRPELVEGHSVILLGALSYSLVRISDVEPHALSRTGSVMDGRLRIAVACFTALSCALCVSFAWAQNTSGYPTKPVRMVTASAGSQTDAMARIISAKLAEKWGQPVVVENRSGAGGAIGASIVAKAAPDGYTLLFQSPQFAVGAALNEKLPYDVLKDFAGIARVGNSTVVLITSPSFGVKSVKELIVFAKAQPKPVLFSSAGAGSSTHMNGERFKLTAGIAATHVGFKGAPEAVIEVAAGRVHYTVTALSVALPRCPTCPSSLKCFPVMAATAPTVCWRRQEHRGRCLRASARMLRRFCLCPMSKSVCKKWSSTSRLPSLKILIAYCATISKPFARWRGRRG